VTDDLSATLGYIVHLLDDLKMPYMLVGSVAAMVHGRSRTTQAFDLVVEASGARLVEFVRALPGERFYADEQAAIDAVQRESLFNVIDTHTGWKVDIIPRKRREFSALEFSRRQTVTLFGVKLAVASVEDTIIAKLEWSKQAGGSARQIEDVVALIAQTPTLDRAYVLGWVQKLGLEAEWASAQL
jgi:hypothetical protein